MGNKWLGLMETVADSPSAGETGGYDTFLSAAQEAVEQLWVAAGGDKWDDARRQRLVDFLDGELGEDRP